MPYRADFKVCKTFSGKEDPAKLWLMKLDWELEGYADDDGIIPPRCYVQAFNLMLTGDASAWAMWTPSADAILYSTNPTEEDVKTFRGLLCERFPPRSVDITTIKFETELQELKQQDESLSDYYKRVLAMMNRVGAKDRALPGTSPISMLESAMLDTIMRSFIKGLEDSDVQEAATHGLAFCEKSLRGVYALAEEARRTKLELTKLKISKLADGDFKDKEIEVLRALAQKTMSKDQINSIVSSACQIQVDHSRRESAKRYGAIAHASASGALSINSITARMSELAYEQPALPQLPKQPILQLHEEEPTPRVVAPASSSGESSINSVTAGMSGLMHGQLTTSTVIPRSSAEVFYDEGSSAQSKWPATDEQPAPQAPAQQEGNPLPQPQHPQYLLQPQQLSQPPYSHENLVMNDRPIFLVRTPYNH